MLLRNLGVIPFIRWGVVWPLALIGLGIWALAKGVQRPQQKEVIINGERVYTADGESSPLLRLLAGVVVAVTLGLVCLIVFGFVAPFVVLFIPPAAYHTVLEVGCSFSPHPAVVCDFRSTNPFDYPALSTLALVLQREKLGNAE